MTKTSGSIRVPQLYTLGGVAAPGRGAEMATVAPVSPGVIAWEDDLITYAGGAKGFRGDVDEVLEGVCVTPGFVDCHTHLPFFGWRDDEFAARLEGVTYRDAHAHGGGIPRSERMLAEASDDDVLAFCLPLAHEMAQHGTTAFELKTGYGGSLEGELRQARLARRFEGMVEQECTVTLLACHAVPDGYKRAAWVKAVVKELIPQVAHEELADAIDIYVEDIAFSIEDLEALAEAAKTARLPLRVHADQLAASGTAEVAARAGARSADHLNNISDAGVAALGAAASTVSVLLPASTMLMGLPPAPARDLIDEGASIALATDFNPGSSAVLSMPEAIAIGCATYGLTPSEALAATTVNAAWVLGLDDRLGALEVGKRADFLVLEGDDFRQVAYRPGHNPVKRTYIGGTPIE